MTKDTDQSNWDMTIEEYYKQCDNSEERLAHYKRCGECFLCLMDETMAEKYDTYASMGET